LHRFPRILLGAIAVLPLSWLHRLGSVLGWAIYGISPTYRRHLRANLEQAGFGEARTRREAIAAAGQMLAELPAVWFRPHQRVVALGREVEGSGLGRAIGAARSQRKAVLLLTPHLGCFEITAQCAALFAPLTVLYRSPRIGWVEPLMREGRGRRMRLAPADRSGVRELLGALKRRENVGLLPDQVPGEGEGEWSEYFGRPAYTMTLAARLAARDDVCSYLLYAKRLPRGEGYALKVRPLPEALAGESPTRRLNRALEALVRECPGQYLWGYNRYKRPLDAPPPAPAAT
jgi:Kdo2-lipid IVA lauroyltransferase/acyltransferase